MTLQELCQKYGYAESTVLHNFPNIRNNILKTHKVWINKVGKGQKAEYLEEDRNEEMQVEELKNFLNDNPLAKQYLESLNK